MKLIDAVYLHRGGSKVLLRQLVDAFGGDADVLFLLDERVKLPVMPERFVMVRPGELSRFMFYMRMGSLFDRILCMGNVPPPLRPACPTVTYFHNRLYLDPETCGAGLRTRLQLWLKRAYIILFSADTDRFAVQTGGLAKDFSRNFHIPPEEVLVWPFWPEGAFRHVAGSSRSKERFGYVSLPYPHKRHESLLAAWELLAEAGVHAELHLTIPDEWPEMREKLRCATEKGARIVNHGFCDPAVIYDKCEWQIYPSESESFGLGLIESIEGGCKVAAPDLPYVREVVSPSVTWRGSSPEAIAAAVVRCLAGRTADSEITITNRIGMIAEFLKKNGSTDPFHEGPVA